MYLSYNHYNDEETYTMCIELLRDPQYIGSVPVAHNNALFFVSLS